MNVPCTLSGIFSPCGRNNISPFPSSFSAPAISSIVLESICDDTANATLVGIFAFTTPVITSVDGL